MIKKNIYVLFLNFYILYIDLQIHHRHPFLGQKGFDNFFAIIKVNSCIHLIKPLYLFISHLINLLFDYFILANIIRNIYYLSFCLKGLYLGKKLKKFNILVEIINIH